jgi:hypothetical protein
MWMKIGSIDQDFIPMFRGKTDFLRALSLSFRRYIPNITKLNGLQNTIGNLYFYFIFLSQSIQTLY